MLIFVCLYIMHIFIYLMTDGKAFAIIIKVDKRKFEKQKHASLDWSILSNIRNRYSKWNFILFYFNML